MSSSSAEIMLYFGNHGFSKAQGLGMSFCLPVRVSQAVGQASAGDDHDVKDDAARDEPCEVMEDGWKFGPF